jgi:gliding motility-associated-like protein
VITITPVDDVPVAVNDRDTTLEDIPVSGSVRGNDTLSGDGGNTYAVVNTPAHGTVTLDTAGNYTYTPAPNFNGTDTFSYKLCDGDGDCDTATVVIIVIPVNDAPVAVNDTVLCRSVTSAVVIPVLTNDTDVDGPIQIDRVSFIPPVGATSIVTDAQGDTVSLKIPGEGTWSVDSTGIVTFTSLANFTATPTQVGYVVSDSFGATSDVAMIILPSAIVSSMKLTPIACNGGTGAIDLTVTGGTGSYTYNWNNGAHTEDLSAISAGTYAVIIADGNGCTHSDTIVVTQPDSLLATSAVTQIVCHDTTGSIDLTVKGGTLPYTYSWSNGAVTEDISGLVAGIYTVRATDSNGCTTVVTDTVNVAPSSIVVTSNVTDVNCSGDLGKINLTVVGGTAPYKFLWSNGSNSEDLDSLTAGIYTVTVTDSNGCSTTHADTIMSPQMPVMDTVASQVVCNQSSTAPVKFTATPSGTNYIWHNSDPSIGLEESGTGTIPAFVAINTTSAPVTATITVTPYLDSCFGMAVNFTITVNPTPPSITVNTVPPTETEPLGSIEVLSPRGAGYSYALDGSAFQASPVFTNVAGGRNYLVRVMNEYSCEADTTVTLATLDTCYIPNVITPDNDGKNDYLALECLEDNVEIWVYNRWGNEVYHSANYRNDWQALGLNGGTYYYVIKMPASRKNRIYKGYVDVIR